MGPSGRVPSGGWVRETDLVRGKGAFQRSRHPQEARPSWPGLGVYDPHAVRGGCGPSTAGAHLSHDAPFLTLLRLLQLLAESRQNAQGPWCPGWGGGTGWRPQPSRPARTHAGGLPVPRTCPARWCEPSARETTVVAWQPSLGNSGPAAMAGDQEGQEARLLGELGRGAGARAGAGDPCTVPTWALCPLLDYP